MKWKEFNWSWTEDMEINEANESQLIIIPYVVLNFVDCFTHDREF